jgi:hypothetical protein
VQRVSDVRQIEIYTVKLSVADSSPFEVEIAMAKLKRYKSSESDQIPAEMIQTGHEILWCEIDKLIHSIWNKEELPYQREEPIIVPNHKTCNKTD